eukprot:jgi/Hompol1/500/HPOL_002535-RA
MCCWFKWVPSMRSTILAAIWTKSRASWVCVLARSRIARAPCALQGSQ